MAKTTKFTRIFKYNEAELSDPGLGMSEVEVKDFYSNTYPELATGHVTGPTYEDDKMIYTFESSFKPKG